MTESKKEQAEAVEIYEVRQYRDTEGHALEVHKSALDPTRDARFFGIVQAQIQGPQGVMNVQLNFEIKGPLRVQGAFERFDEEAAKARPAMEEQVQKMLGVNQIQRPQILMPGGPLNA